MMLCDVFQSEGFMALFLKSSCNGLSNLLFPFLLSFQKPHARGKIYVQSQGKNFKIYIFLKDESF